MDATETIVYLIWFFVCYLLGRMLANSDAFARRNEAVADFLTQNNTHEVDWNFFLTQ